MLFLFVALPGCLDPEPPVLFVPLDVGDRVADPFAIVVSSLEQLGFRIQQVDRANRFVASQWKPGTSFTGQTRTRVEVRVQESPGPPGPQAAAISGFVIAVPTELLTGDRWMMHGEDEETRRQLVATLLARMQATRRR